MKMDLVTSIAVTVVGIILGFFVTNLVVPPLQDFSFPTVDIKADEANAYATLVDPDPNVFNSRALNPTVEVFVGGCKEYALDGKCLEEDDSNNQEEDDENEDNEDENEQENIDDYDFGIEDEETGNENEDEDEEATDTGAGRSLLEQYRAANRYTPTTTKPDDQEND